MSIGQCVRRCKTQSMRHKVPAIDFEVVEPKIVAIAAGKSTTLTIRAGHVIKGGMRPYEAHRRGPKTVFASGPPDLFPTAVNNRVVAALGTVRVHVSRVGRPIDLLEACRQRHRPIRVPGTKAIDPIIRELACFVREAVHATRLKTVVIDAVESYRIVDALMPDHIVVIERVIGKITAPSNPLSAQRRHPFGHESIAPPEGDGP